jgi:hypothetical protein
MNQVMRALNPDEGLNLRSISLRVSHSLLLIQIYENYFTIPNDL